MKQNQLLLFFKQFEETFPKLIRDKIPKLIIANEGKPANTKQETNKSKLISMILRKIVEESMELYTYKNKTKLTYGIADVVEVIEKLKIETGITTKEINQFRKTKNKTYGNFSKSVILISK